jgi:hydroxyacylglutathione hydrolase
MLIKIHTIKNWLSVSYLVEFEKKLILVDTGPYKNHKKILKLINKIKNKPLVLIFITHAHFDHFGAAKTLKDLTKSKVGIHKLDAPDIENGYTKIKEYKGFGKIGSLLLPLFNKSNESMKIKPDILFEDGNDLDYLNISAKTIHTPGHTKGSASLLIEDKYLFVGDLLTRIIRPAIQNKYADNWEQLIQSFNYIKTINPELIYTGHGNRPITNKELSCIKIK